MTYLLLPRGPYRGAKTDYETQRALDLADEKPGRRVIVITTECTSTSLAAAIVEAEADPNVSEIVIDFYAAGRMIWREGPMELTPADRTQLYVKTSVEPSSRQPAYLRHDPTKQHRRVRR